VVFGGNGAVHAMHQADDLGISRVLIPKAAPAFSALGLLVADYLVEKVRASLVATKEADPAKLEETFVDLERTAEAELIEAGLPTRKFAHQRFAQCRYPGQTFDIDVPVDRKALDAKGLERLAARFHKMHEGLHTYARREEDVLISALRTRSAGVLKKPALQTFKGTTKPPKPKARRDAYFGGKFRKTAIYDGPQLRSGQKVAGPAVIEERFTTIVVPPGWTVKLDKLGTYVGSSK